MGEMRMAAKGITAILAGYFNSDPETKKPLREFASEVRELSDAERMDLATGVVKITGDTIKIG